jgi:hypothetical protein
VKRVGQGSWCGFLLFVSWGSGRLLGDVYGRTLGLLGWRFGCNRPVLAYIGLLGWEKLSWAGGLGASGLCGTECRPRVFGGPDMGVHWPIWCLSKNTGLRANGGACNSSARGDVTRMGRVLGTEA